MTIEEFQKMEAKRNRGKSMASEHDLQVLCVNYFRMMYPGYVIYATPNGGYRNAIEAKRLRAEGVTSGIPDLCIAVARKGYHGFYIELKNGKYSYASETQKKMMEKLDSEGYKVALCHSFDEYKKEVDSYMSI